MFRKIVFAVIPADPGLDPGESRDPFLGALGAPMGPGSRALSHALYERARDALGRDDNRENHANRHSSAARLFSGAGRAVVRGENPRGHARGSGAPRRRSVLARHRCVHYARLDASRGVPRPLRSGRSASRRSTAAFFEPVHPKVSGRPACAVVTNHGGREPLPAPPSGPSPETPLDEPGCGVAIRLSALIKTAMHSRARAVTGHAPLSESLVDDVASCGSRDAYRLMVARNLSHAAMPARAAFSSTNCGKPATPTAPTSLPSTASGTPPPTR